MQKSFDEETIINTCNFGIIDNNIYSKPWSRSYYQRMWKFFAAVDNILDIKRFMASIEINEACK